MTYDHHSDRLSYSKLKVLADDPRLFYDSFVARTYNRQPSERMNLGSLLHAILLQPSELSQFATMPDGMRRGTKAYHDWRAKFDPGVIEVTEREYNQAVDMVQAIIRHPIAGKYFAGRRVLETPVYGQLHGLEFQCKPDLLHFDHRCIVDLKTTRSLDDRSIKWAIKDYAYDLQIATYLGLAQLDEWRWIFVVVGDRPQIRVVKPTSDTIASGEAFLARLCGEYKSRMQSGDWRSLYEIEESEIEFIRSDEDETVVTCNIDVACDLSDARF